MSKNKCKRCVVGHDWLINGNGPLLFEDSAGIHKVDQDVRFAYCPKCGRDLAVFWASGDKRVKERGMINCCPKCGGDGTVPKPGRSWRLWQEVTCPDCNGDGLRRLPVPPSPPPPPSLLTVHTERPSLPIRFCPFCGHSLAGFKAEGDKPAGEVRDHICDSKDDLLRQIQKLRDAISELLSCGSGRRGCHKCIERLRVAYYTTGPQRDVLLAYWRRNER